MSENEYHDYIPLKPMNQFAAGLLTREAELLFRLEPLLREAQFEADDPENEGAMKFYYDGVVRAYETAIALIKGEKQ